MYILITFLSCFHKSSNAAVVAFVAHDGKEYSANNPTISPPQADPDAILKPGEWMALDTFEGHVFYVREVLHDGSTGNILLAASSWTCWI